MMAPKHSKKKKKEKNKAKNKGLGMKKHSKKKKKKKNKARNKGLGMKMSHFQCCARTIAVNAAKAKAAKCKNLFICGNEQVLIYVGKLQECPPSIHSLCTWGDNFSI